MSRALFATKIGRESLLLAPGAVPQRDPFQPVRGFAVGVEQVRERKEIKPLVSLSGSLPYEPQFELPQLGDVPVNLYLKLTISALTAGAGATYTRLCDFFPVAFFPRIEVHNSQEKLYTIHRDYWRWVYQRCYNDFERANMDEFLGANLTAAERNTRATAAQTFHLPLFHHWHKDSRKAPQVLGLSEKITFKCYSVDSWDKVIQSDVALAATPATITTANTELVLDYIQLLDDERAQHVLASNPSGMPNDPGLLHLIRTVQVHPQQTISAANTQTNIELRNFSHPVETLVIQFRRSTVLTDRAYDYFNYDPALFANCEIEIEASGVTVLSRREMNFHNKKEFMRGVGKGTSDAVFTHTFAEAPLADNAQTGYIPWPKLTNPTVKLYFSGAGAVAEFKVDIFAICLNFSQQAATRQTVLFRG